VKKCNACAEDIFSEAKLCKHCGTVQEEFSKPTLNATDKNWFTKISSVKRTIFIIVLILIGLAAINGQNLISFIVGTAQGQVTLDTKKIENKIKSGIKDQVGEDVDVSCPGKLIGKVGDVRKCVVVDSTNTHYFVDVTIQSEQGDVIWQVENK
jgi:uncharacterized membrane protein YvbJ